MEDFPHEREQTLQTYIEHKKIGEQKLQLQREAMQKDIREGQIKTNQQQIEIKEL